MALDNDLTGIKEVKQTNSITDVGAVQNSQHSFENVNFEVVNTELYKEAQQTRETSLEDHIAGIPLVDTKIKLPETKPDISKPEITNSFSTRDEIMSKLGLMDENFNYTDTYTNYIAKGGTPLPGYEYAHQEMLAQERYDSIFQKVEDGTMSYDTALMEAYGKDILAATFGIDVTSVAYWRNKYNSMDFSNPFANQYLMDQVKAAAEEYHRSRQAGEYANRNVKDTLAASYVGDELSATQVKDIFADLDKYAEEQELSDKELLKQINSGQIDATSRLIPTEDGQSYYYLHTDGELYILDNKEGDHHGTFKLDKDGQIKEISLNGSGAVDFLDHFAAGFAGVFTGLVKIGTLVTAGFDSLFTGQSYVDAVAEHVNTIDAGLNDWDGINWLTSLDHIDLDGFTVNSASDWLMAVGDISGMLVGGMALAGIGGAVSKGGSALMGVSFLDDGTQVMKYANFAAAKAAGHGGRYATGAIIKSVGNLASRSTGLYEGANTGGNQTFKIFGKTMFKNQAYLAPQLNHMFKTVPSYAVKDFYSSVQQLNAINIQAKLNGQTEGVLTDSQIAARALKITGVNYIFSSIFAGGINDNQTQRLSSIWNKGVPKNPTYKAVRDALKDKGKLAAQNSLIEGVTNETLKSFLKSPSHTIAANTFMDFLDNVFTMNLQTVMTQTKTKDGKMTMASIREVLGGYTTEINGKEVEKAGLFATPEFWKSVVQAGVMTAPTLKSQLSGEGYNIPINALRGLHAEYIAKLDAEISKASDPKVKETIQLVKQDYINKVNETEANGKKLTYEERILNGLSSTVDNFGYIPKTLEKSFEDVVTRSKIEYFSGLYDENYAKMIAHDMALKEFYKKGASDSKFIKKMITDAYTNLYNRTKVLATKKGYENITGLVEQEQALADMKVSTTPKVIEAYETLTGSRKAAEIVAKVDLPEYAFDYEGAVGIKKFSELDPEFQTAFKSKLVKQDESGKTIGNTEGYYIYELKKEAGFGNGEEFNDIMKRRIFRATMETLAGDEDALVIKLDDEHYAMSNIMGAMSSAFALDTQVRMNTAFSLLHKHDSVTGANLALHTLISDNDFKVLDNADKYETLQAILSIATENEIINTLEAADALRQIAYLDTKDADLIELQNIVKERISKMTPDTDAYNRATPIEKMYMLIDAVSTIKQYNGNSKIVNNSEFQKKLALLRTVDPKTGEVVVNPDTMSYIKLLSESGRWTDESANEFTKAILKESEGTFPPEYRDILDSYLKTGVSPEESKQIETTEDAQKIADALLISSVNEEIKKDLAESIGKDIKKLQEYESNITKHSIEGKVVTIDLTSPLGEHTYELLKDARAAVQAKINDEHVDMEPGYPGVLREFELRRNLFEQNGKPILTFDISNELDRQAFITVATELNIFKPNTTLDTIEDVIYAINNKLNKGMSEAVSLPQGKHDYISFGTKTEEIARAFRTANINKLDYQLKTLSSSGEIEDYDISKDIATKIHINKVSDKVQKKRKGIFKIIPFLKDVEGEEVVSEKRKTEHTKTKQGISASKAAGSEEFQGIESLASKHKVDHDTGTYYYVREIIETISDPEHQKDYMFTIYCKNSTNAKSTYNKLKSLGIADTEDSFYTVTRTTGTNNLTLTLKPDCKMKMLEYLETSTDFNMFKILPLISDQFLQTSNYLMFSNKNGTITYKGEEVPLQDMYNGNTGLQNTGIANAQNISIGFDTHNTLKTEIFGGLAKANYDGLKTKEYKFDPFEGRKKVLELPEGKSYSEYKQDIIKAYEEGTTVEKYENDYEASYIKTLLDAEKEMIDNEDNDDHLLLLQESSVVKRLQQAVESGEIDDIEKLPGLISDIKGIYAKEVNLKQYPEIDSYSYSYASPYILPYSMDDSVYTTGNIIRDALGSDYIIPMEDMDYADTLVRKAIEEFKSPSFVDAIRSKIVSPSSIQVFEQNDILRIFRDALGNDGYIPVEDADKVARLTDEQLELVYSMLNKNVSMNDLKALRTTSEEIYKFFIEVQAANAGMSPKEYREYKNLSTPSLHFNPKKYITSTGKVDDAMKDMMLDYAREKDNTDAIVNLADQHINNINSKYNTLTKPTMNELLTVSDKEIRNREVNPATAEVLNMENIFARRQATNIIDATINKIRNSFDINDEEAISKIAGDMYYSAMKSTKGSEWQSIKVYSPEGNEVLDASFNGRNHFEILSKLQGLKKYKDHYFVTLERHPLDSQDAIEFKYTKLNKNTINKLKEYYLYEAHEGFRKSKTFKDLNQEEYYNKIKILAEENPSMLYEEFEGYIKTHISEKAKKEIVVDNVYDVFNSVYNKEQILNVLVPQVLGRPNYNNDGINNYLQNRTSSLTSLNPAERSQSELATYQITESIMNDTQSAIETNIRNNALQDLFTEEETNLKYAIKKLAETVYDTEDYHKQLLYIKDNFDNVDPEKLIIAYIAYSKNGEALSYKTNGITLKNIENDVEKIFDTKIPYNKKGHISAMTLRKQLLNPTAKHPNLWADLEGIIPDNKEVFATGTLEDIFQLALEVDDGTEPRMVTYYLLHKGFDSPEEYIKAKKLRENSYYKDSAGYRDAVEEYAKGIASDKIKFITIEELNKMFSTYKNANIFTHNGNNYDFKYLSDIISNNKLKAIDTMTGDSILYSGDSIDRKTLEILTGSEVYASFSKSHYGADDVANMKMWYTERIKNLVDPAVKAKTKMKTIVDELATEFNHENSLELYSKLDDKFKTLAKNEGANDYFPQEMADASTSSYILRQFGYMREENLGYALSSFANDPELFDATGFTAIADDIKAHRYKNTIDLIAEEMTLDDSLTAEQALNRVINRHYEKGEFHSDLQHKIFNAEVTIDRSDETFNKHKQNIINNLGKFSDTKYRLMSREDYNNVKQNQRVQKILVSGNELMKGLHISDTDIAKYIMGEYVIPLSSTKKGLEQFQEATQLAFNSKTADKLLQSMGNKYKDIKGLLLLKRQGSWNKVSPITRAGNTNLQELKYNPTSRKLEPTNTTITNVLPNEIVIDRKVAQDLSAYKLDEIFDAEGNGYIMSMRQPSAYKGSSKFFKVRVVEGMNGNIYCTPATWKTIFAGDFDGDAITTFTVNDDFSRALAKFETEYMFVTHSLQEDLYNMTNDQALLKKSNSKMFESLEIAADPRVVKASWELDKALKAEKDIDYTNLIKAIEEVKFDNPGKYTTSTDDILENIGVVENNGHSYIRNFSILTDKNSYSHNESNKIIADQATYRTNLVDSIYGFHKQRYMTEHEVVDLTTSPLQKIDTQNTRLMSNLVDNITSIEWTDQLIDKYFETITMSLKESSETIKKSSYSRAVGKFIQDINLSREAIKELDIEARNIELLKVTQGIYTTSDELIRSNAMINKELSKALEGTPSDAYDLEIKKRSELLQEWSKLSNKNAIVKSNPSGFEDAVESLIISDILDSLERNERISYIDSAADTFKENRITVAVVDSEDLGGSEDAIWVNSNSKAKAITDIELLKTESIKNDKIIDVIRNLKESHLSKEELQKLLEKEIANIEGIKEVVAERGEKTPKLAEENIALYKVLKNLKEGRLNDTDAKVLARYNIEVSDNFEDLIDTLATRMAENKAYKAPTLKARERKINSRTLVSAYKTLLKSNSDLIVVNTDEGFLLLHTDAITNKKLFGIGKGMSMPAQSHDGEGYDIIISANAISRFDKLGYNSIFNPSNKGTTPITFDIGTGKKTKDAMIFNNVPIYLLENLNIARRPGEQKLDLMTMLSNSKNLTGLATQGSTVLKKTDDGRVIYDNATIYKHIDEANNSHSITWEDASGMAQLIRATAISELMNKYNLWDFYNQYHGEDTGIHSKQDFDSALKYYNPTSKEFYLSIQECIKVLEQGSRKPLNELLSEMSEVEQLMFSKEIEDAFSAYEQGAIVDYKGTKLTSKTKSRKNVAPKSSVFIGRRHNPSESNARRNPTVLTKQAYYLPWNTFYRVLNGYNISSRDVLDAVAKGQLYYGLHEGGEVGKDFRPMNTRWITYQDPKMGDQVYMNDPKAGQIAEGDIDLVDSPTGRLFKSNNSETSILDLQRERGVGSLYSSIAKNYFEGSVEGSITHSARMGQFLTDMLTSDTNVDGMIKASNRNISNDIAFNAYIQKYKMTEDGPVLTVTPSTKKGSYKYLTSKGTDFVASKFNFYSMNEVYNKADTSKLSLDDIKKLNVPKGEEKNYLDAYNSIAAAFEKNSKLTKNFTTEVDYSNIKDYSKHIDFTFGKDSTDVFKHDWMASQGIHIDKKDKGDTINVSMAMEKYAAEAAYIEAQLSTDLANLKKVSNSISAKEFEDYCLYNWLMGTKQSTPEDLSNKLAFCGKTLADLDGSLKQTYDAINKVRPEINQYYNKYIDTKLAYINTVSKIFNEPFGNTLIFLSPFMPNKKEIAYGTIQNAIHSQMNFNKFDPTKQKAGFQSNMMFNFFEANAVMDREIGKLIGLHNMSDVLIERNLIDNVDITNKAQEFLSENFDVNKLYIKKEDLDSEEFQEAHRTILDVIESCTDINVPRISKRAKNEIEQIRIVYDALEYTTREILEALPEKYGKSLESIQTARASAHDRADTEILDAAYNHMMARVIAAQRIMELNPNTMTKAVDFVSSIEKQGYSLCNKWGQKISRDTYINPISDSSLSFLKTNIEIAANNQSPEKFAQWVVEKALCGEIYIAKKDMIDQLEQKLYTKKNPGRIISKLQDISRVSASIQMAMPSKILSRILRFTGFDYITGGAFNPNTYRFIPTAAKEISAAVYSQGKTVTEDSNLYQYLIREGQPLNVSGKDPINFTDDINKNVSKITDKLTEPLAIQNHLGRYAIWLATKESFDEGKPWYGPCYHLKDQIDALGEGPEANADKALFIMDYILGSPGGFPYITKKTSGLMMYATFPMNLTRTGGAYLMSLGKLAQEGITSENAPHWMKTVVSPSASLLITAYLSNLAISYICDMYNVDEETEKEWQEQGVTIDPIGTLIGGTPHVVYDSINPIYNLKEMYFNPFTNKYNDTLGKKFEGLISQNILSRLNPAIKTPIEVIIKKDFYGSSPVDTSNSYTLYENATRKVLGFIAGTGVANNVVDQYKIDEYNPDSTFASSLWKGLSNGFNSDLGNQKSWKKDTSNYYATIESVRNFYYATENRLDFDATPEDLTNAEYMKSERSSTSSYGEYDKDDYQRVNNMLKKMIKNKTDATTVYLYIAEEYNKGTSEATLRSALNNNSIIRKLNTIDKEAFYKTLSSRDLENLEKAIMFENKTYRMLQEFFPVSSYKNTYYTKYKKPYYSTGGGSSSYYPSYPKTYYPKKYYPSSSGYSTKYKSYNPYANIDRVSVKVSPEMAVWSNDFNAIEDLDKKEWYLNNPLYNNLSDYEKRQRGGN